jgi:hypothetical protein
LSLEQPDFAFEFAELNSLQDYLRYESIARAEMSSLVRQGKANYSTSHLIYLIRKKSRSSRKQSTLIFADLACSEKIRKSVYLGEKLLETVEKTSNLIYFSKCINYLLENKRQQISRKEDYLVDLLYEALGGDSMTCYLISVSLREEDKDLTFNTLEFAQKVSSIENIIPSRQPLRTIEPSSIKENDQSRCSKVFNQSPKKEEPILPSWLAKCNDILNENGSEIKRLQTRNLDLETQVVKLEKMLMMSHIDFSSASRDSPEKNLSFFSIENDLCLNNILLEEEALPTNPRVSFSKQHDGIEYPHRHLSILNQRCHNCEQHLSEKDSREKHFMAEMTKLQDLISVLKKESEKFKSELASNSTIIQNLTVSNNSLIQEKQQMKEITSKIEVEWESKRDQFANQKREMEQFSAQQKVREESQLKEIAHAVNLRLQLQSELQQAQSHLKITLTNEKLAISNYKKLEGENIELRESLKGLSWKFDRLKAEHEQLKMVNDSQGEEYNRALNLIKQLQKEKSLLNTTKECAPQRGILRSSKEQMTGKTIAQLRLELKSQNGTSRKSSYSENKENEFSMMNDSNSRSHQVRDAEEELEYLSLPINFRTSATAYPSYRPTAERRGEEPRESDWTQQSFLDKLDLMKASTPLKKPVGGIGNTVDYKVGYLPASELQYQSATMVRATEKKREICDLLDLISNCQMMIEAKLKTNEIQESDFNNERLRLDLYRLWREMEDCLKSEENILNSASQLEFLQEMFTKLFELIDFLITSRDKMVMNHRKDHLDKSDFKRIVRCQAKFLTDLHIDEELLSLKREKFLKSRHAVAKISKFYILHRLKLETGKLKRLHKTNHQMFQAGSGKFLLQTLMNGAENFFLQTLERLRPDVQVSLDKRTSQWVALARLESIESSS